MASCQLSYRPAIFVIRHGEREDYQWKAKGLNWQSQAERPWDTPLTSPGGHLQGAAAGRAIAKHCERLGLLPVTQVYVSPLVRCAQTGGAAASALGVADVVVCTALAETMNEDWYRSWAIPGADSTWGGPVSCPTGTPVARQDVHPMALGPAQDCLSDAAALQRLVNDAPAPSSNYTVVDPPARVTNTEVAGDKKLSLADATSPAAVYCWDKCETHEEQSARMATFCEVLRAQQEKTDAPHSVLLVSHGGPTTGLFKSLTGVDRAPSTGYTGLFCYAWNEKRWEALVVADHAHLDEVEGATKSGPTDMVEQAP